MFYFDRSTGYRAGTPLGTPGSFRLLQVMSPMASVFSFGMAVLDLVYYLDGLPEGGQKYYTRTHDIIGGGCAANAAVAITRLGGTALLAAQIGDDPFGDIIADDLDRRGVDLTFLKRWPEHRSSYSSVYITPTGERQVVNYRGTFDPATHPEWIADAPATDAFLADTVSLVGCTATLALARRHDRPAIVDAERLHSVDPVTDATHLAFSSQGLEELTGETSISRGMRLVRPATRAWICVTDGDNGVFFFDGDAIEQIPAFAVDVVDTLAAGDVWHGAFALGIAENLAETDAIRLANAAAALKCSRRGGRDIYPDRIAVEALLATSP